MERIVTTITEEQLVGNSETITRLGLLSIGSSAEYESTARVINEWRQRTGREPSDDPQF